MLHVAGQNQRVGRVDHLLAGGLDFFHGGAGLGHLLGGADQVFLNDRRDVRVDCDDRQSDLVGGCLHRADRAGQAAADRDGEDQFHPSAFNCSKHSWIRPNAGSDVAMTFCS